MKVFYKKSPIHDFIVVYFWISIIIPHNKADDPKIWRDKKFIQSYFTNTNQQHPIFFFDVSEKG